MSLNLITPSRSKFSHLNNITKTAQKILSGGKEQLNEGIAKSFGKNVLSFFGKGYKSGSEGKTFRQRQEPVKKPTNIARERTRAALGDAKKVMDRLDHPKTGYASDRLHARGAEAASHLKSAGVSHTPTKPRDLSGEHAKHQRAAAADKIADQFRKKGPTKEQSRKSADFYGKKGVGQKQMAMAESEHLNELSDKARMTYLKNSGKDQDKHAKKIGSKDKSTRKKAVHKYINRVKGTNRALKKFKEEEEMERLSFKERLLKALEAREELEETSKAKLGKYAKASAEDSSTERENVITHGYSKKGAKAAYKRIAKREKYHDKAVDRLSKEEETKEQPEVKQVSFRRQLKYIGEARRRMLADE